MEDLHLEENHAKVVPAASLGRDLSHKSLKDTYFTPISQCLATSHTIL